MVLMHSKRDMKMDREKRVSGREKRGKLVDQGKYNLEQGHIYILQKKLKKSSGD